jgi:hypothetical protein
MGRPLVFVGVSLILRQNFAGLSDMFPESN